MGCLAAAHRRDASGRGFEAVALLRTTCGWIIGEPLEGTLPCGETNTLIVCFCR
jgi:hypothetical protein